MKRSKTLIKTILTLIIFFSISIAADKSYKILSTDIQTTINNDGTINFVETREFSFKGDFTFVYQVIPKRGFDKIYDIQVSENGVAYLNKNTKEDGTFLIDERKNSYRIYLYHNSSNENKKFTVKYTLENPFTVGEKDSQFYWIYLSDRWDKRPGDLYITQKFSSDIQDNDIIYDIEYPSNSDKYEFNTDNSSLSFFSSDFSSSTEMKLRTIFPSSYFVNVKMNDENFSLAKLEEKKRNKELVQYFIGFLVVFSMVSFISYYRRNLKKFKLDIDENQQFTSFPSDHHPVVINGLIYRELTLGPTGSGILSTLFELGSLKKISIEVIEKGKWFFKSKRLKVTVHNTNMDEVQSSFAKLLLTRLRKFGKNTTFKDVFSEFQMRSYKWKKLKTEELSKNGWVDTSGADEKYRLAIIQFLIMGVIIAFSIIFKTFLGFLSILTFTFFLSTIFGSRLTKEGQLLYDQWGLFVHQLSENEINVKHFDPELLLQYCVALGVQPDSLKKVVENVEHQHDSSYMWMYYGSSSDIGSVASIVSDIATTGTTVSAAYGGDGGGGGGGAGGGGGGGAG
jgi:uncharacterized membrane protein|tara:strand:- start:200 stop:1897 length:1698 start_codon:yes stop_codon:yes gene_type:complete